MDSQHSFDYREVLRTELLERIKRNAKYSVWAMARDLGVSCAFLSQVLSGRRHLSEDRGVRVARRLKWGKAQSFAFIKLIRIAKIKDPQVRGEAIQELSQGKSGGQVIRYFGLSMKAFQVVADWHHFAIMELSDLPSFEDDPAWIAARLGITRIEAATALDRLFELKLLVKKGDRLKKAKDCMILSDVPSEAIRKFHSQHLQKASKAIYGQLFDQRHLSGITLAVNRTDYGKAVKMISEFTREFEARLGTRKPDCVYHLSFQFYQLDEGRNEQK